MSVPETKTLDTARMGPDRKMEEDPEKDSSSERELVMPQMVVAMGDDSSDEDASDEEGDGGMGPQGDGYMLLPSDADHDMQDEPPDTLNEMLDEVEFPSSSSGHPQQQQPQLPLHLSKLLPTEIPTQDPVTVVSYNDTAKSLQERRQVMAADDDIQKAMAGVSLPGLAVPPWARVQGDEGWKEQLNMMIQGKDEKRREPYGTSKESKS